MVTRNNGHDTAEKAVLAPPEIARRSIQGRTAPDQGYGPISLLFNMANQADEIDRWGTPRRDSQLRDIWRAEPIMAGAIYSMVSKGKTLGWTIDGPQRQVSRFQPVLANAEFGHGWRVLMSKTWEDILTVDRGAFWELIRPDNADPSSPVIGLAHLDALRCTPTGDLEFPVIYSNRVTGQYHRMAAWQVVRLVSMPSPDESKNDVGLCAVSRALKALQITRDLMTYKREKLSSRPKRGIVIANGITQPQLEQAIRQAEEQQDNKGLQRFGEMIITAALDPSATVDLKMVEFASLPDGFDEESSITLYVYILALAMGVDAREFWPATASGATKADALVQAMKARGKGIGDIITTIEEAINWQILPDSLSFHFDMQDDEEDAQRAQLETTKSLRITTMYYGQGAVPGVIDRNEARQMLADEKLIPDEFLTVDVTDEVTADDVEQVEVQTNPVVADLPADLTPQVAPTTPAVPVTPPVTGKASEDGLMEEIAQGVVLLEAKMAQAIAEAAEQKKQIEAEKAASLVQAETQAEAIAAFHALAEKAMAPKPLQRVVVRKDVERDKGSGRITRVIEHYEVQDGA